MNVEEAKAVGERRPGVALCIAYFLANTPFKYIEESRTLEYEGRHCWIWIKFRPEYCDRGLMHVEVEYRKDFPYTQEAFDQFNLDEADMWPRLYFHPDTAWKEISTWLTVRNQWADEPATEPEAGVVRHTEPGYRPPPGVPVEYELEDVTHLFRDTGEAEK